MRWTCGSEGGTRSASMQGMLESMFNTVNYTMASKMMDASVLRHQAIASNLANVETAGYKRVDIDSRFESALKQASRAGDVERIRDLRPQLMVDENATAVRGDGNNVEMDKELLAMNRNALTYQFLTQYMSRQYQSLNSAIQGQVK